MQTTLWLKIDNPLYLPLVVEAIGTGPSGLPALSIAHYSEQNGDLMRDPEMCFELVPGETPNFNPYYWRNDNVAFEEWSRESVNDCYYETQTPMFWPARIGIIKVARSMDVSIINRSGKRHLQQRATKLVFLACGVNAAAWAPLVPFAKGRVQADDQQFGLLLFCFGLGSILLMPIAGRLAARWGCKRLILVAAAGAMFALIGLTLALHAMALAVTLFVFGACIGSLDVVMNVQALRVDKDSGRELMPSFHAFFSLGGIAGAVLMSALLWAGLRPPAAAIVIICPIALLLWLSSYGLLADRNEEQKTTSTFALPAMPVISLGVLAFFCMLAEGSMADWSALYLVDATHTMAKHSGIGFAAFSIAMTCSRLIGSRGLRHYGRARVVTAGALLAAAGFVLSLMLNSAIAAVCGFFVVGLGLGNIVPVFFSVASEAKGSLSGNVAFVTALGYSGILAGPAVIGFIVHLFSFSAAFCLIAFVLAFVGLASIDYTKSSKSKA